MSDSLERRKLARAAARLGVRTRLPVLVLMTDEVRLCDPVAAARALPKGSMVVVRAREDGARAELARAIMREARDLFVSIAGDGALAVRLGADGLHLPEACIGEAAYWRARHRGLLLSAAAHSCAAVRRAALAGVDAVFLSPVFATPSHPGRAALSPVRANLIARRSPVPVYTLGGIDAQNAARLSGFAGIAAVGALDV